MIVSESGAQIDGVRLQTKMITDKNDRFGVRTFTRKGLEYIPLNAVGARRMEVYKLT